MFAIIETFYETKVEDVDGLTYDESIFASHPFPVLDIGDDTITLDVHGESITFFEWQVEIFI